jgi:RimJ/RimL family protein N-acetyltransferase
VSAAQQGPVVTLRAQREGEVSLDSGSAYDDWGEQDAPPPPELDRLLVVADGEVVGDVSWHSVWYGPNAGSKARNIGISLVPAAQGRGIGSRAQRLIADHIFATTDAGRVEASTDVANIGEQRALEKAGFRREGVLRGAQVRADGRHDLVSYSILRGDLA